MELDAPNTDGAILVDSGHKKITSWSRYAQFTHNGTTYEAYLTWDYWDGFSLENITDGQTLDNLIDGKNIAWIIDTLVNESEATVTR